MTSHGNVCDLVSTKGPKNGGQLRYSASDVFSFLEETVPLETDAPDGTFLRSAPSPGK